MITTITVQIESERGLFKSMAEHVALELMGFGNGVREVTVEQGGEEISVWHPPFVPGDRVMWIDPATGEVDTRVVGTVTDMRRAGLGSIDRGPMMFRVEWVDDSGAGGLLWIDQSELVRVG